MILRASPSLLLLSVRLVALLLVARERPGRWLTRLGLLLGLFSIAWEAGRAMDPRGTLLRAAHDYDEHLRLLGVVAVFLGGTTTPLSRWARWMHVAVLLHVVARAGGVCEALLGRRRRLLPVAKRETDGPSHPGPRTASWWSRVTYHWLSPALRAAGREAVAEGPPAETPWLLHARRRRGFPDIPAALQTVDVLDTETWTLWCASASSASSFSASSSSLSSSRWRERVVRAWVGLGTSAPPWRLLRGFLAHSSGRRFVDVCVPLKLAHDLLALLLPALVRRLLAAAEEPAASRAGLRGGGHVLALGLALGLQSLLFQGYLYHLGLAARQATSALQMLLLRGLLETPLASAAAPPAMDVVGRFTVDAGRCGECLLSLHNTWSLPLLLLGSLVNVYASLGGAATLVGVLTWSLCAAVPRPAALRDEPQGGGLRHLHLALSAARAVRGVGACSALLARLTAARRADVAAAAPRADVDATARAEGVLHLAACAAAATSFLVSGGRLDPAGLVPALVTLGAMRYLLAAGPPLAAEVARGAAAGRRVEAFLARAPAAPPRGASAVVAAGTLRCEKASFAWSPAAPAAVLRGVSLALRPGEWVLLRGPTGAGTSALLLALLGELDPRGAAPAVVGGPVAYVGEVPWLREGSIRANICLRRDGEAAGEAAWYAAVLHACALGPDLDRLPRGDDTAVGEGGGALSEGQRARVALARAVFHRDRVGVVVVDDILASLDAAVQDHLLREVFQGCLRDPAAPRRPTLLLVSRLPVERVRPDRVVEVRADGTVVVTVPVYATEPPAPRTPLPLLPAASPAPAAGPPAAPAASSAAAGPAASASAAAAEGLADVMRHVGRPAVLAVVLATGLVAHVLRALLDGWVGVWRTWLAPRTAHSSGLSFLGSYAVVGILATVAAHHHARLVLRLYGEAADDVYHRAVRRLLRVAPSAVEAAGVGPLLGILGRDQDVVDRALLTSVRLLLHGVLQTVVVVGLPSLTLTSSLLLLVPVLLGLVRAIGRGYHPLVARARAWESDLHGHSVRLLREAVAGGVTARADPALLAVPMRREMEELLEHVHVAAHAGLAADRWAALRLDLVSASVVVALAAIAVWGGGRGGTAASSPALAGSAVVVGLPTARTLALLVRRWAAARGQAVSAARLWRLQALAPVERPAAVRQSLPALPDADARRGPPLLQVQGLSARYGPAQPDVLHHISFALWPGECVGLVGRTGSGKSSVFHALLRLMDAVRGRVVVRDPGAEPLEATALPLSQLRGEVFQWVPQTPLLLEGTVRSNLLLGERPPPPGAATEARLAAVLARVQSAASTPLHLDDVLTHGGSNLSAGQRQLLGLARVLLRRPRVVLLDEVHAHADEATDALLGEIIHQDLLGRGPPATRVGGAVPCAVLLIAHRPSTLHALCDRLLVLDNGRCTAAPPHGGGPASDAPRRKRKARRAPPPPPPA